MQLSAYIHSVSCKQHTLRVPEQRTLSLGQSHSVGSEDYAQSRSRQQRKLLAETHRSLALPINTHTFSLSYCRFSSFLFYTKKGKGSPYSITERRVPELIPVLGSQPAGDESHQPGGNNDNNSKTTSNAP